MPSTRVFALSLAACLFISTSPLFAQTPSLSAAQEQRLNALNERIAALEGRVRTLQERSESLSRRIFKKDFEFGKPFFRLKHRSNLGCNFLVQRITVHINEKVVYEYDAEKQNKPFPLEKTVLSTNINEGLQRAKIEYFIQGHGCGVFAYMKKHKLTLNKTLEIPATRGKMSVVSLTINDKGGNDINQRLDIQAELTQTDIPTSLAPPPAPVPAITAPTTPAPAPPAPTTPVTPTQP